MPDEFQAEPPRSPRPEPVQRPEDSVEENPFRLAPPRSPSWFFAVAVGGFLLSGGLVLLQWMSTPQPRTMKKMARPVPTATITVAIEPK
jgi:hypothetical protein